MAPRDAATVETGAAPESVRPRTAPLLPFGCITGRLLSFSRRLFGGSLFLGRLFRSLDARVIHAQIVLGGFVTLPGRAAKPANGLPHVLLHAAPGFITQA